MARSVASDIQSGSVGLMAMGQELFWLAEVLPTAAAGDWKDYNTTGTPTRQQLRQVLPWMDSILDPSTKQSFDIMMSQYAPVFEKQLFRTFYVAALSGLI